MKLKHLPNIITGLRCCLVFPIAYALMESAYVAALVLFVVAGVTDGIDGFVAKKFHWQSELGGMLDPIADKFLLVTSLIILAVSGVLPVWLVVLAVTRDIVILIGATLYYFWVANFTAMPSYLSKVNTVMQIILVFWVVLVQIWPDLDHGLSTLLMQLTFATIVLSGGQYIIRWSIKAWNAKRTR